ncbi:hypothetical protein NLX67_20595, partial [Domibacillus sp. A3M-37]|uniref:hypothetical protein n=1 Tax=Domibacillus sp. A3M-37 TaxID=2962037 RepID=UPI0035C0B069|nr:hypothetical protein [Domibacillus sp. A3M-37]
NLALKHIGATTQETWATQKCICCTCSEEVITNQRNRKLAWSKYALATEFILCRMDETLSEIKRWGFTNRNQIKETAFPVESQNGLLTLQISGSGKTLKTQETTFPVESQS